jgi:hypothetical protein
LSKFLTFCLATSFVAIVTVGHAVYAQDKAPPPKAAKQESPCKGLDETACKAKSECLWTKPGKTKSYCRLKRPTVKKAVPSKDAPKK